jgi:hypothetical protein
MLVNINIKKIISIISSKSISTIIVWNQFFIIAKKKNLSKSRDMLINTESRAAKLSKSTKNIIEKKIKMILLYFINCCLKLKK